MKRNILWRKEDRSKLMKRSEGTWRAQFKKAVSQDFEFIAGSIPAPGFVAGKKWLFRIFSRAH